MYFKRITSLVISLHLLFITVLLFKPHPTPVTRVHHIKVHTAHHITHSMKTPPKNGIKDAPVKKGPQALPPSSSSTQKKAAPPLPQPQPSAKKPAAANKPAVMEKGKPMKKADTPQKEIWHEIDQALAKIEKKSYPTSKPLLDLPKASTFLDEPSSENEGQEDESTLSHVMGFLYDTLHLPDIGEVKIAITVRKDGTVAKVVVLRAESQKNRLYLQEHLPLLQLPMQLDRETTWTITFCHEI